MKKNHLILTFFFSQRDALITKEFISVATLYVASWVAINFLEGNLLLWTKYVLKEADHFSAFIILIQVN